MRRLFGVSEPERSLPSIYCNITFMYYILDRGNTVAQIAPAQIVMDCWKQEHKKAQLSTSGSDTLQCSVVNSKLFSWIRNYLFRIRIRQQERKSR